MTPREKALKAELAKNLKLFFFEDEEIERAVEEIEAYERRVSRKVLALAVFFSNLSAFGVPKALGHVREASRRLSASDMERWLGHAFDLLDSKGLEPAMRFMAATDRRSLDAFLRPGGLPLEELAPMLETYLRGVSGTDIEVKPADISYADSETAYLPKRVEVFESREDNVLLLKLSAAHKWAQMAVGSLAPPFEGEVVKGVSALEALFIGYAGEGRRLALDIYNVLEAARCDLFLHKRLPGLIRRSAPIRKRLLEMRPPLDSLSEKAAFVEGLYRHYLAHGAGQAAAPGALHRALARAVETMDEYRGSVVPDTAALLRLCKAAGSLPGLYSPVEQIPFVGVIRPEKVSERMRATAAEKAERLKGVITRLIETAPSEVSLRRPGIKGEPKERAVKPDRNYIMLKGVLIELDERAEELLGEPGGELPGVLVKGSDIGGRQRYIELSELIEEGEVPEEPAAGGIKYDEWDYRRAGYRKGWCTLVELDVHPGREPFVDQTLRRYSGYVGTLRKKFEMLRTEPRTLKRQRDGEDIDLDAVVEAVADRRAGLSPSENLFMKIERAERSIAALFLLDMSGSTKGWINEAEKEALVLMCEALESLGDGYSIYGFSGMTRNKCEFYRVKAFDEPYSGVVKKRIAGIEPKDYTRMGPPIRHSTNLLKSVEARTKLLITLSDGKPEDYDAYKGDYGVEDTRKALIEAKQQAIHPFCITIDKEAGSYLPHMYGEVNYTFIDDVWKLPARITDIYLRLTR